MSKQCGRLTVATLVLGALLAAPAWLGYGADGLLAMGLSGTICLVAGCLAVVLSERMNGPGKEALAFLAGMGLRMALVLIGAVVVSSSEFPLRDGGFLWWLTAFYLVGLFVETRGVLKGIQQGGASSSTSMGVNQAT